ncbi:MAG: alpha/beta hydrolase [Polyangiaceae bacterium]|nr:alpha/beta hydrolase [Polyangiaceae bacterium]
MLPPRASRHPVATGLSLNVLEWGAEDASRAHTVVLVHGFLDLAWGWEATVSAGLGDGLHVVAPDLRGHGESDRVGTGGYYHFMDYVADLASLVERLGRDQVSLVGHSMGGSVCSYLAGAFPDRFRRLALLEGLGPPEDDGPLGDRLRTWMAGWQRMRERPPKLYPTVEAAAERMRDADPLLDAALALDLARKSTACVEGGVVFRHDPIHLTRAPYPFRFEAARELWAGIECPVLHVDGSESPLLAMEAEVERRLACFRVVRRARIEGAGHMMQRHRPGEVAGVLRDFLEQSAP